MQRCFRKEKTLKKHKLDFIKIVNASLKDTIKKMKTQAIHWEKIFIKYVCEK